MNTNRNSWAAWLALCTAAVLLAACGGGGGDKASQPGTAVSGSAAIAPSATQLFVSADTDFGPSWRCATRPRRP